MSMYSLNSKQSWLSGGGGALCAAWSHETRPLSSYLSAKRPAALETVDYLVSRAVGTIARLRITKCPSWYARGQCLTYLFDTCVNSRWVRLHKVIMLSLREVG